MAALHDWLSPTRMVGLTAYGAAFIACGTGWVYCRRRHARSRLFSQIAGIQFFLFLDMAFDWRWKIHDFWENGAMALGVYGERRPPQLLALALICSALAMATIWIFREFRGQTGVAMAVTGTVLSAGIWCCDAISYHYLDAILYHLIGKVMVVSLVWSSLAVVTCFGVWLDSRRSFSDESNLGNARPNSVRLRNQ